MGALTVQHIVDVGTKPNFALNTATTSDTSTVAPGLFLVYKNTGIASSISIASHFILDNGDTAQPHVVALPATTGEVWIPLRKSYDDGTGNATITLTSAAGVTVAVVALP